MTRTAERHDARVVGLWLSSRAARLETSLAVVRAVVVLLSVSTLSSLPSPPTGAVEAHLLLLVVAAATVALVPVAERTGREHALGLVATVTTIAFYAGYTLGTHDTPGAATLVGVLALLEAPLRYGPRGALLSVPPVMGVALTHPAQDAAGSAPSTSLSALLCVLLLTATLLLQASWRRWTSALDEAQGRLTHALTCLPLGVAVVDDSGTVLHANPALAAVLGVREAATLTGQALAVSLPAPRSRAADRRADLLAGVSPTSEWEYETADGRWLRVGASPVQVSATRGGAVVHVSDITATRREHADLVRVASHDALTGLLTRAAGTQALAEAIGSHAATAVLFLDLDGFKQLNDRFGHTAGDAVLRRAAARVRGALRPTEVAVRWGGDEMVVVCRDVHDDLALAAVAHRLLEQLHQQFSVEGVGRLTVTASLGAVRSWPGATPEQVVSAADGAMYDAKRAGGDRCALAAPPALQSAPAATALDLPSQSTQSPKPRTPA